METNEIIIPDGWTFFSHNTNTERWPLDQLKQPVIEVNKKKVLSVITERDIHLYLKDYGVNHRNSYSFGKGIPVEIRCLICSKAHLNDIPLEYKKMINDEFYYDRRNFGGGYGHRHHSIPPQERLIRLGESHVDNITNQNKLIIYVIPERLLELYKVEILNDNNRTIILENDLEIKNNPKM